MSRATLTIDGYLAADASLSVASNGNQYLNLTIPHTPRRQNRDTGQWEDVGDTLWVRVTLWRDDAEAFAPYAVKGTQVTATGQPEIRTYQNRDGQTRAELELKFAQVGIIPRTPSEPRQPERAWWDNPEAPL